MYTIIMPTSQVNVPLAHHSVGRPVSFVFTVTGHLLMSRLSYKLSRVASVKLGTSYASAFILGSLLIELVNKACSVKFLSNVPIMVL